MMTLVSKSDAIGNIVDVTFITSSIIESYNGYIIVFNKCMCENLSVVGMLIDLDFAKREYVNIK